jgi:hypothetical protein
VQTGTADCCCDKIVAANHCYQNCCYKMLLPMILLQIIAAKNCRHKLLSFEIVVTKLSLQLSLQIDDITKLLLQIIVANCCCHCKLLLQIVTAIYG